MAAKISLGMIVRDEGRTLEACLESVKPFVEEIVIGLGGPSTDNTEEIARKYTDKVFQIEWTSDFSEARNQVLEKCTGDYFLWLDGDDVLVGGDKLQNCIDTAPNVDMFCFGYDYSRDEQGINNCYLVRERLIKRHREMEQDYKWIGKVHEVLVSDDWEPIRVKVDDIIVVHHKPPMKHEADRNVSILLQQLEDTEPNPDPRILAYLGSEHAGRGLIDQAIQYWQRFVQLSGWDEEKYQTLLKISKAYRGKNLPDKAEKYTRQAIGLLPHWPDAWFEMARIYFDRDNFNACIEHVKIGSSKPMPETMLIINPLEYSYEPLILLGAAYLRLDDPEAAVANYEEAFKIKQDGLLRQQITLLSVEVDSRQVAQAFLTLRSYLGRHDEWLKVRQLFNVVPKAIEQYKSIQETWQRSMRQTAHIFEPQIMADFYNDNPHWNQMPDELVQDPVWLKYPRMAFALEVARRIKARNVVDWGCSDGFIALPLARELGIHATGFDLDPRCIELATVRAKEWGIDARFQVGNIEEIGGWEGEKADLAIFFEVIEHVVSPEATLERLEKTAKHIAITTPFMSWEPMGTPDWDKDEPKGHLRIFDVYDMERLLTPRGRIWNLHQQAYSGGAGWIFADYEPGATADKTIMIGAMGAIEKWGPTKLAEGGLGGSETAVIKLAEAFAAAGHRPIVYNDSDSPGYFNGVCYRPPENFRPEIHSDYFIAWRWPEAADLGLRTDHLFLWMHDIDAGDRLTPARAAAFERIVVLSEWHRNYMMQRYPFLREDKFVIIGNGVDLSRFENKVKKNPKKVVYSSSPDRGLDVILEKIWPTVLESVPDAELHVYYGWDNFDKFAARFPSLVPKGQYLKQLFVNSKNVVQHGRIPQDRLAQEMQEAAIWLYPTHFTETYCITAVEAQLAGAIPITNHLAALAETVGSGIIIEGDVNEDNTKLKFAEMVIQVLKMPKEERAKLYKLTRENAPAFSWADRANQWLELFEREK